MVRMSGERELNECLRQIYEAEGPKLYGYLVKKAGATLAEDIMQEAFTRLFTRLKKAADVVNARAYLFQIARHLLYHETSASAKFTSDAFLENKAAPEGSNDPDRLAERDLLTTLGAAVKVLNEKETEIFEMRWNLDLTQVEIAAALGKSERQIRRDLEKVVSKLRAFFKEQGWGDAASAFEG
jgi:RNA polymerase sigma factor (sigma-70 family)